jgi:hypothetical protein
MKAEILKIAGVKSEKEFYKKYPSEEAFMKVHGKAFKKAQTGAAIQKAYVGISTTNTTTTIAPSFNINQYGIGAQTMGQINPIAQTDIPPSEKNPNFMYKDKTGPPNEASNINKGFTGNQGEINPGSSFGDSVMPYVGAATSIFEGIKGLGSQKKEVNSTRQMRKVTDVQKIASGMRPEEQERRYLRPEDMAIQPNQMFPTYGVGTNVLARDGVRMQTGGEIQNTYAPNNLYDDLGYEPLDDSNVKQYYHGGHIPRAQEGFSAMLNNGGFGDFMNSQGGGQALGMLTNVFSNGSAESQIGSGIGTAAGTAFGGPVGGMIGGALGNVVGGLFNKSQKSIKRDRNAIQKNQDTMMGNQFGQYFQNQYSSVVRNGGDIPSYEDGGYMNPEYNPQLITMFGDHNAEDFANYAKQYRAGGHLKSYTPPSERALQTYENGGGIKSYGLGGELETHWGGGAETMSYNPYLPGSGETVMFRGKSHEEYSPNGETGIGVTYGGNPVEVERGEPMVELEEGGTVDPQTGEVQKSGVVFGNLKIPNQYIDMLGDKNAKGKKFKNYVANLSKTEAKQNKLVEKTTNELNDFTPLTSFDKLKMSSLEANMMGANMKLKDIADKKINAASLQNAINDTAEENGLIADSLAKGKIQIDKEAMKQQAKYGGSFSKAQGGEKLSKKDYDYLVNLYEQAEKQKKGKIVEEFQREFSRLAPEKAKSVLAQFPVTNYGKSKGLKKDDVTSNFDQIFGKRTEAYRAALREPEVDIMPLTPKGFTNQEIKTEPIINTQTNTAEVEEKPFNNNWMSILNAAIPYLRPTDQESLDMEQLYPEYYALSSNQLEPVPAQGYQPELGVPYDISLQDQLNANQSDYRAMQRMTGYNPAAQANLNAQKYQANQQVLGNQFRANQEMKDRVYTQNRNILNDAKLKNLDIFDRQYGRQAQALSNTKATTQAALNSIADKYAKNKLENRTLGVYENLYNYRFDRNGRAINMNGLAQLDWSGGEGGSNKEAAPEGYEYETVLKKKKEKDAARNGSIVKSYKNI